MAQNDRACEYMNFYKKIFAWTVTVVTVTVTVTVTMMVTVTVVEWSLTSD